MNASQLAALGLVEVGTLPGSEVMVAQVVLWMILAVCATGALVTLLGRLLVHRCRRQREQEQVHLQKHLQNVMPLLIYFLQNRSRNFYWMRCQKFYLLHFQKHL